MTVYDLNIELLKYWRAQSSKNFEINAIIPKYFGLDNDMIS